MNLTAVFAALRTQVSELGLPQPSRYRNITCLRLPTNFDISVSLARSSADGIGPIQTLAVISN